MNMIEKQMVIMAEFSDVRFDARVLKTAKCVGDNGFQVILLMYNTDSDKDEIYFENNIEFHIYKFRHRRGNSSKRYRILKYVEAFSIIFKINLWIIRHRAKIYHAHNMIFLPGMLISSMIRGGKLIYEAHEVHSEHYEVDRLKGKLKNQFNEWIERYILHYTSVFIQASEERALFVSKKYKVQKPYVINNYVPYVVYHHTNKLRDELKLKENIPIMLYTGGIYLGNGRRLDNVIRSLKNIHEIYFVIIGFMNDSVKLCLQQLISNYDLYNKVFILPPCPQDKLIKYISSASFGIIPLDGQSVNTKLSALNKISEYFMGGLPILCSNYKNLHNIVKNNPIGIVGDTFNVNSIKSIENAIKLMIENRLYKKYKNNALELASKFFNWESEEKKILQIYNNITL